MDTRRKAAFLVSLLLPILVLPPTPQTLAKPILKPKKYHGPIPRRAFSLSIGFVGGADNAEMFNFLDNLDPRNPKNAQLRAALDTEDFSSGLQLDASYMVKAHPNFAFRFRSGVGFLSSTSRGLITATNPDSLGVKPLLDFDRSFDVLLFSVEASALYFFQDASVEEFQTYIGGGFSLFLPLANYEESLVDDTTKQRFGTPTDETDFSANPGVHAVLGALYHFRPTLAFHMEGRVQIAQSKFTLDLPTTQGIKPLTFDVDYTGFVLTAGISKFF